ncbi:glycosyltransferase [Nitrosomonas sp. Is24]|uniref:glycosyltransferase n=1 Tax=Nitrosomonas sp. Is24 TaxID=3080533 RepID=UPI00294AE68A|nr:glycosyltransferase [Nitrosomonas sp. Is24]MDV6340809.1 glycosyltransferase [Nitrosomonas sp. Is24]
MKLSILIKALNEEALIANCLEAALAETLKIGGEVILVDSLSTDRTVEIAKHYPVRVIQFSHREDCGCASAVQLGYQYAQGEYLYVLDGDMVLQPGFLLTALNYLESNPDVAGVAGKLIDTSINNWADKRRASEAEALQQIKEVVELGGGGLYRRKAIESVGYLAHRWLPACEEAELGDRLRAKGWRLVRLPEVAVFHTGYSESTSQMLFRLWRNRRLHAYGMYLRSALGHPWCWLSMRQAWFVFAAPMLHIVAGVLAVLIINLKTITVLPAVAGAEFLVWLGGITVLAVKKKSITNAILSVYGWNFFALAAILGAMKSIPDPMTPINAQELTKR